MKTSLFRYLCLMVLMVSPVAAVAQSNIQKAFDAIINCKDATLTLTHILEKDPLTNGRTGQCEAYDYTLPASRMKLVESVVAAINRDQSEAYYIGVGKAKEGARAISLAVGNGSDGVRINPVGSDYVYALFLAPEDSAGVYRYAYGICYRHEADSVKGKIVMTYATTLKHRQATDAGRSASGQGAPTFTGTFSPVGATGQSWFDSVMGCLQLLPTSSPQVRIALATRAYKLIADRGIYPGEVTNADKATVRDVVRCLLNDNEYSETMLQALLRRSYESLK